ncbi:hypothetical protein ASG43_00790 [Aureimonas sp. Leaf454]|uniref:hypothetical protein n=1 Tax=Aureimonas sp. Leaf454 TaxID=1736381 RepID=UPI00070161B6|nr:hypothetical protein [Aureimonas sp. Leaf454]KQT54202.1 hypothetical protein ASG43_00790 [Aureimonas sp. Leaf454]
MRRTTAFAIGWVLIGPAAAQTTATQAGADALAGALAAYTGPSAFEKKIIAVAPEGAGYRITLSPNAAIAALLEPGSTFDVAPVSLLVAERADGNWDVSSAEALSIRFDVTSQGVRQSADYRVEAGTFSGVYAPKLGTFLSGSASYPGATITASDAASDVKATIGRIGYEMSGRDGGNGAVDATVRQTVTNLVETVSIKADPAAGTPDATVDVTAATMDSASVFTGMKSRALLDLWAFAVSKADKDSIVADQEELRTLLNAALPIWTTIDGHSTFGQTQISSAFGKLSMTKVAVKLRGDGISKSGALGYALELEGLSAQSPLMPGWTASLMPQDITLALKVDGLDLETPAKRAIAEFDLSKDPALPAETSDAIALAFSENPPRFTLEPSRLKARDFDVTFSGDVVLAGIQPEMNMTIEAAGLDTVISTLQAEAATDPSVNQIVGGLSLAKGFAKALPDGRSQWIVSTKADGSVVLNGNMLVPPTAETGPAPTDENALPTEDPLGLDEPAEQ